jgi:hypothetical protein
MGFDTDARQPTLSQEDGGLAGATSSVHDRRAWTSQIDDIVDHSLGVRRPSRVIKLGVFSKDQPLLPPVLLIRTHGPSPTL